MLDQIVANEELAFLGTVTPPFDAGEVTVLQRAEPGDRSGSSLVSSKTAGPPPSL